MALVYPFKGVLYNESLRTENTMAPPYDVINENERKKLQNKSKLNIVNLTLPDTYDKARELLSSWFGKQILKLDDECSFYTYTADYEFGNNKRILKGFIAALKVEAFGGHIKPHEKTLKGPKIDRFNLIAKTNAMFCPIMGLYTKSKDVGDIINSSLNSRPIFSATFENIEHKLFKITDKKDIETIHSCFKDKDIIIADGHHRYETALMIKEYYNKQGIKEGGFDYILILLIDAGSGGLSLSAIHRVVANLKDFDWFLKELRRYFYVNESTTNDYDFIMYYSKRFFYLKLKDKKPKDTIERLNSNIFENYIYKKILRLSDDDIKNQKTAGYAHSEREVIDMVDRGEASLGFILKPMSYDELAKVTEEGLTVPQKSTFFYPKIPSGLVGYHFKSIEDCKDV